MCLFSVFHYAVYIYFADKYICTGKCKYTRVRCAGFVNGKTGVGKVHGVGIEYHLRWPARYNH